MTFTAASSSDSVTHRQPFLVFGNVHFFPLLIELLAFPHSVSSVIVS